MADTDVLDHCSASGECPYPIWQDHSQPAIVIPCDDDYLLESREQLVDERRNLPVLSVAHTWDLVLDVAEHHQSIAQRAQIFKHPEHLPGLGRNVESRPSELCLYPDVQIGDAYPRFSALHV